MAFNTTRKQFSHKQCRLSFYKLLNNTSRIAVYLRVKSVVVSAVTVVSRKYLSAKHVIMKKDILGWVWNIKEK